MQQTDRPARRGNRWAIPVAILGAVLVAAAAILYWVVVPARKELPADTNTTRQFTGTARVLLVPQALAAGDLPNALLTDTPVTAERNVKVLATDGGNAEVADTRVLRLANGQELGGSQVNYAVDRKSLAAATNPPQGWQVTPHEGLTVSWPIGAGKQDYTAWINETQTTTPVRYLREETKADVQTYVYEVNAAAAPVKDEQVLASLPASIRAALLAALAPRLPLPDAVKARIGEALPLLGDPVPLNYTYEVKSTYWVEPATGLVVDTLREEVRRATLAGGQVAAPIYDVQTQFDEASVAAAAKEAKDKSASIATYSKTLPLLLLIPGLLLLLVGIIGFLAGRRRAAPATGPVAPAARRESPPPPAGPVVPPTAAPGTAPQPPPGDGPAGPDRDDYRPGDGEPPRR